MCVVCRPLESLCVGGNNARPQCTSRGLLLQLAGYRRDHRAAKPQLQEVPHHAPDLLLEALQLEAEGLLGGGCVELDGRGAHGAAAADELTLHRLGEAALRDELGVVPPRLGAEDVAPVAGDGGQEGLDVCAGDVVDVDGRAGEGASPLLAEERGEDDGVGALDRLIGVGRDVVAAEDEGRVEVHDVEVGLLPREPRLGAEQGGDLARSVGGELALVRLGLEACSLCGLDGRLTLLGALHLRY